MNVKLSKRLKKACARVIMDKGGDIDLKHATRVAKKMWRRVPTPDKTETTLRFVAAAACFVTNEREEVGCISRPQKLKLCQWKNECAHGCIDPGPEEQEDPWPYDCRV